MEDGAIEMNKIREVRNLLLYNWKPLVGFEIAYKFMSSLVMIPLMWGMFDLIMKTVGYAYLTLENIFSFLTNPLTLPLLFVLFLSAANYAMIDISAVVFTLDQSKQKKSVCLRQILRFSLRNSIRVWNPRNLMLVVVILVLLPFLNIGIASGFLTVLSMPEFISDYIQNNQILSTLLLVVTLFLTTWMIKWLYAFHYYTLEGCSFREAARRSGRLGRKKRLRDFGTLLLVQFVSALVYVLFMFLALTLAVIVGQVFANVFVLRWITSTFLWMALLYSIAVIAALAVPISYAGVSVLYYGHKRELGEAVVHSVAPEYSASRRWERLVHRCGMAFWAVVVAGSLAAGYLLCSGKLEFETEYIRKTEITAHRGASGCYPENTMSAFEGAKELGAHWIELDVQQSRDGQIIVIHDTNFQRTTGVNANTWDLTYEEIAGLDAGSHFDPAFAGEKIPLLREVVAFAKENDMKLNIELKPTGHERDFEKMVVDIICQAGMKDSCVITSQIYEVLECVKAYDVSITTVYVMSLAYGDVNQLTAADHFSVEATSATQSLISSVHCAGKEIYVWTVNTKENIMKMIEMNVDNIITDDIILARQCLNESRYSNLLAEYLKLF